MAAGGVCGSDGLGTLIAHTHQDIKGETRQCTPALALDLSVGALDAQFVNIRLYAAMKWARLWSMRAPG